jgi:hypothetical protein
VDVSPADDELALADDFEDEPVDESSPARTWQFLPSPRFAAAMLALGVALALGWRYSGLEQWAFAPPTNTAQAAQVAAPPEGELARMGRELDALKKTINELSAVNQQLTAHIAALQAGQQELKQRSVNVQASGWHAQADAMKYQMVAQPKAVAGLPKPRPTVRAEVRTPRAAEAPLQLTAPRP